MKKQEHSRVCHSIVRFLTLVFLICTCTLTVYPASFDSGYRSADEAKLLALDCLMNCAFSKEYNTDGKEGNSQPLVRWTDTIRIFVKGSPAEQDYQQLDSFIMELATHCPNIPNIRRVSSEDQANVTLTYCPLDQMGNYVPHYVDGNWGFFYYNYNEAHEIYKVQIAIASDVNSPESKHHLLMEELVGGLGLTNDHYDYSDSILYGEWTTTQQLSDLDWLMINMLYDPDLYPGISRSDAYSILYAKIIR